MNVWEFLDRYIQRRAQARELKRTTLTNPDEWFYSGSGSSDSASGLTINEAGSLEITAVFACVRILSGLFAQLPAHVVRDTDNGTERAYDHPLYSLIHDEPNPEMTSYQWREAQSVAELLWGNAYNLIDYDADAGKVGAIWPVTSDRVTPYRDPESRAIFYDITSERGPVDTIPAWQVLHIPGLGFDGIVGRSAIGLHHDAFGLAKITEQYGGEFFANGARPGVVLEHPGRLSRTATETIKSMWEADHKGPGKFHLTSVLGEGMKLNSYSIPNEDAQFLQTRSFQVAEIARIFGVPLWMIGEHSKDTSWGSGIEQQNIALVTYTILPRIRRWEQGTRRALLSPSERAAGYRIMFDLRGLLRGDSLQRAQLYHYGIGDGWLTRAEARELEEMDPIEGLEAPLVPSGGPTTRPAREQDGALRGAFHGLYREAWDAIMRRGKQDWSLVDRGKLEADAWRRDVTEYARRRLSPIDDAWREVGGRPSRSLEALDECCGACSDVDVVAAQAADHSLGG